MQNRAFTVSASPEIFSAGLPIPAWKRYLDIVGVLLSLPVVLPLTALIAAVIKIVSRGPVLFRQERIGYLGLPFTCLKFRTMTLDAESSVHEGHLDQLIKSGAPMTKLDVIGDSRLIPLGWLLRATGLDELPQLVNVLRGEMSLVGPRPCTPHEFNNYLPWHRRRFSTLPGLTGLWQVSGKNRTTFKEMVEMDIFYSRNKSLWFDLKIIFKTIPALSGQVAEMREMSERSSARTTVSHSGKAKQKTKPNKTIRKKEEKCTTLSELAS